MPKGEAKINATPELQAYIETQVQAALDAVLADLQETQTKLKEAEERLAKMQGTDGEGTMIVLRVPGKVGDRMCSEGEILGVVSLMPGVSLNYLVDAVRNGVAGARTEGE